MALKYAEELEKFERDIVVLEAMYGERRPESVSKGAREDWAVKFSVEEYEKKLKESRESPDVLRFIAWRNKILQDDNYHIVARVVLLYKTEYIIIAYKRLLGEGMELSGNPSKKKGFFARLFSSPVRTLEDVDKDLNNIRFAASDIIQKVVKQA